MIQQNIPYEQFYSAVAGASHATKVAMDRVDILEKAIINTTDTANFFKSLSDKAEKQLSVSKQQKDALDNLCVKRGQELADALKTLADEKKEANRLALELECATKELVDTNKDLAVARGMCSDYERDIRNLKRQVRRLKARKIVTLPEIDKLEAIFQAEITKGDHSWLPSNYFKSGYDYARQIIEGTK